MPEILFRDADIADASAIASLHVASWRDAYAAILDPAFLAGPIEADRLDVWRGRLTNPPPGLLVQAALAPNQDLIGFVCAYRDQDPRWGSLVDNLHVAPGRRGGRIGERLLRGAARRLIAQNAQEGLHLWVFEANTAGLRFYQRLGGQVVGAERSEIPAADSKTVLRVHWPTLAAFV